MGIVADGTVVSSVSVDLSRGAIIARFNVNPSIVAWSQVILMFLIFLISTLASIPMTVKR